MVQFIQRGNILPMNGKSLRRRNALLQVLHQQFDPFVVIIVFGQGIKSNMG